MTGVYGERFNEHAVPLKRMPPTMCAYLPLSCHVPPPSHHVDTSLSATKHDAACWRKVEVVPVSSWPAGVTGCYPPVSCIKRHKTQHPVHRRI